MVPINEHLTGPSPFTVEMKIKIAEDEHKRKTRLFCSLPFQIYYCKRKSRTNISQGEKADP